MTMSPPLILVSDLDGTYLERDGVMPNISSSFLTFLERKNIQFIIATSRSPHSVADLFRDTQSSMTAICSDGATTISLAGGQWSTLQELFILPETAKRILDYRTRIPGPEEIFIFLGSSNSFSIIHHAQHKTSPSFDVMSSVLHDARIITSVDSLQALDDSQIENIRAISFFDLQPNIEIALSFLRTTSLRGIRFLNYPEVRHPPYYWLDITNEKTTKGNALRQLNDVSCQRSFHLIALGDGLNDLSVFEMSDISLCPVTAVPEIRRIATITVPTPSGASFLNAVTSLLEDSLLEHLESKP
jgi:HAD superfamily hydrolase (TIGR01484 family)